MKLTEHLELALRNGHGVKLDHGDVEQLVGKLRSLEAVAEAARRAEQYLDETWKRQTLLSDSLAALEEKV